MNFTRSDEEYILIGKIAEAKGLLISLQQELSELECERVFISENKDMSHELLHEVEVIDHIYDAPDAVFVEEEAVEAVEAVEAEEAVERKPIGINEQLFIVANDEHLAAEISSGKNTNVRWGAQTYVSSWSRGKKYDPKNVRISLLRKELRCGRDTIRKLSGSTGLAINTIKDLIREMDKQGFFLHK
jgi:hypothetical protein